MAVIIREKKTIEGKEYPLIIYRTRPGKLITADEKKQAEELDRFLAQNMRLIQKNMKDLGLLSLKGKKGKVHRLWYEVGKELAFVMDTSMVAAEDREYVWRAIYDHTEQLAPGPLSERAIRSPETSHFSYCYKLSQFPWGFVDSAGDWTSWCEFFDRKETKNDPRIIEWLGKKAREGLISGRQNWLRPLTKAIHTEFEKKDTTIFTADDLNERLEKVLSDLKQNERTQ